MSCRDRNFTYQINGKKKKKNISRKPRRAGSAKALCGLSNTRWIEANCQYEKWSSFLSHFSYHQHQLTCQRLMKKIRLYVQATLQATHSRTHSHSALPYIFCIFVVQNFRFFMSEHIFLFSIHSHLVTYIRFERMFKPDR